MLHKVKIDDIEVTKTKPNNCDIFLAPPVFQMK